MTDQVASGSEGEPTLGGDASGDASGDGATQDAELARGAVVGRYVTIDRLGAGGMGVVYVAYDPELDRKVALKVLRPRAGGRRAHEARTRVLREAQALAKLTHPAVVTVHDVGVLGERVWLAMELVVGQTLTAWLKAERRSWREQVVTLARAAEGLAAAHAAGLVHRDFKPDNVMVGVDGRVRVMDFGLARAAADRSSQQDATATESASGALLDLELTREGALVGTPAYMSPEQLLGQAVDERTDQFSFCVTVWEGLFGERPFGGDTLAEAASAAVVGEPRGPANPRAAPRWLRRILLRGLARAPDDRFSSMGALLHELQRGQARMRTRRAIAVVAGAAVALGGVLLARTIARADQGRRCDAEGALIASAWPAHADAVHAGLVATGVNHAADTAARVAQHLDRYATEWLDARAQACRRLALDGTMTQPLHDRAVACLDERRAQLESFTELLASTDAGGVHRATSAALALPSIAPCIDDAALMRMPVEDLAVDVEGDTVRRELARVSATIVLGEYADARVQAEALVTSAESLGNPQILAHARFLLGCAVLENGDVEAAAAQLEQAFVLAGATGADATAVEAATKLVALEQRRGRFDEGLHWSRLAEMSLRRLGAADEGVLDAKLLATVGALQRSRGDHDQAIENDLRALAVLERVVGPEHPDVGEVLNKLGAAFEQAGRWSEAEGVLRRALELRERTLGATHPAVAATLANLVSLHLETGEGSVAADEARRALAITEAAYGREHRDVAVVLVNLAAALRKTGDLAGALAASERALAINEKVLGHDDLESADVLVAIGQIHAQRREREAALANYERALAILERAPAVHHLMLVRTVASIANLYATNREFREAATHFERALQLSADLWGPDHPLRAQLLHNLGASHQGLDEHAQALDYFARAVAIRERALGPDHAELASSLYGLGVALVGLHREQEAVAPLERALGMDARIDIAPTDVAKLQFALARALWGGGGDRVRALELARAAARHHRERGPDGIATLTEIERWLAKHPPQESAR